MRKTFLAAFAVAAIAGLTPAHAVTSVPDGSFNAPAGGNPFTTYNNTTMGPWHVNGSVDLIGNYWQGPPAGGGSVDLAGNYPAASSRFSRWAPAPITSASTWRAIRTAAIRSRRFAPS